MAPKKTQLELQASSKKRTKNSDEDDEPVLNVNSKKRLAPQKTLNKLINKTALEPEASSVMKNLPEDDHDHKTVLNVVDSNKLKTDDGNKGIETSKTPLKSEDDEPWNPSKPLPEGFVPWLEHDHDKCIAEQLGIDLDAPIPAEYADYFYNQATPSPEGSFNLHYSDSELAKIDPLDFPREPTPPMEFRFASRNPPSSPSDGDLGSDDDSDGLGGPITRSKTKKREEALYDKLLELECSDAKTAKWLKRINDDEARWSREADNKIQDKEKGRSIQKTA
ncbi:hypothetical protein MtrunA17_Chr5g0431561 [Medicago truncatula]|uniref:Uncharacterized protein n=1 Tax=Medicago truncatula TaxID=3880 RepID=A0A396HTG1_MEDTR|nr:uncharacterized protein LOC11407534 [Medicago truncatula]RHN56632.1 hypothetical protein MtrunA17_Chr5g0431561 [Medicago truncatula]